MVVLMTAPFCSEKKYVKSDPPPPKLILTGDLARAYTELCSLAGI
jgi:hypothetical protein